MVWSKLEGLDQTRGFGSNHTPASQLVVCLCQLSSGRTGGQEPELGTKVVGGTAGSRFRSVRRNRED